MAVTISFENEGRGVVLDHTGRITGEELLDAVRSMYAQDSDHRLRYQICDYSNAEALDITEAQLRSVAMLDKRAAAENPDQIVALVGKQDLFRGAEKRYAIYADVWAGFDTRSFTSITKARAWIETLSPDLTTPSE